LKKWLRNSRRKQIPSIAQYISLYIVNMHKRMIMASGKAQYVVALIAEFAEHYGLTTAQAAKSLSQYKALELYDRQYDYLHTQSFASNVRDLSAYCRRMGGTL
jgi:hypothetical protein